MKGKLSDNDPMVSRVRVSGGLGNQLFQFAFGLALSRQHNVAIEFDRSQYVRNPVHEGFLLDRFIEIAVQHDFDVKAGRSARQLLGAIELPLGLTLDIFRKVIKEAKPYTFRPMEFPGQIGVVFSGYWQSEKYFFAISDQVQHIVRETLRVSSTSVEQPDPDELQKHESVCVHVRRGDYASDPRVKANYGLLPKEYYQRSVELIAKTLSSPHYYIFSDDISWVRRELDFPSNTTYVSDGRLSSIDELRLMSNCRHFVTANSSYSWWAAYLGADREKRVYTPKQWFLSQPDTPDLVPENWIRIDVKGGAIDIQD